MQIAECPDCGNARVWYGHCPYCRSITLPILNSDTIELNIKSGNPTVEEALDRLTRVVRELHDLDVKAIVLIHGYGSTGKGGRIKWAVHEALEHNQYADRIEGYYFGEQVPYGSQACQDLLKQRPGLRQYLKHFKVGNAGMTILLLGSGHRSA